MTQRPLMTLRFALPYPPSVNTYWRHIILGGKFKKARAQTLLSEQGREYRVAVQRAILEAKVPRGAVSGRLAVHATAYPPDRRARDLDNLWKGCLDSLKHAGVIADDGDIDDLHIVRGPVRPGGCLVLAVTEIEAVAKQMDLVPGATFPAAGYTEHHIHKGPLAGETVLLADSPPF